MTRSLHFAVVILNWNGLTHLRRYLPSVLATEYECWESNTHNSIGQERRLYRRLYAGIEGYTGRCLCFIEFGCGSFFGLAEAFEFFDGFSA